MPSVCTAITTVSVLAVLTGIAGGVPAAQAQDVQPLPACDPAVPSALVFAGLPDRIPYGLTEEYGFVRNPASDRKVPHPVVLNVFEEGESIYRDTTRSRGDDIYLLTLYVFGSPVRVHLQFTEVAPTAAAASASWRSGCAACGTGSASRRGWSAPAGVGRRAPSRRGWG